MIEKKTYDESLFQDLSDGVMHCDKWSMRRICQEENWYISPELIGALIAALKLVNSCEIFISFPLGKCASWIICRNVLHHTKGLEIGFHRRFLFFFYHDNNLVYSLSNLNVIIFVNIHPILFLKRHTDRKSWNLASLQVSL